MDALFKSLANPPLNKPDAIGVPHSILRILSAGGQCFGRTVYQVSVTILHLTYQTCRTTIEGMCGGIGAASGAVMYCKNLIQYKAGNLPTTQQKPLTAVVREGMHAGAKIGAFPGYFLGVGVALSATISTLPLNMGFIGLPCALCSMDTVRRNGCSAPGEQKINRFFLELNNKAVQFFQKAHTYLTGQTECPVTEFFDHSELPRAIGRNDTYCLD